jgi:large subunit ribosomal protein L24
LRATTPIGEVRPLSGAVEADGSAVTLQSLSGSFAGGQANAVVAARRDADGVAVTGHLQLSGADGAKLRYRNLAMPGGRATADLNFAATGRSASALVGGLSGSGSVTLENARINGVDPNIFQIMADASDAGQSPDQTKLKAMVDPLMIGGTIAVASAEFPLALKDGQLRIASTMLNGSNARLVVSGGYDISADQVDVRATLSPTATTINFGGVHPEIQLLLFGTPNALTRTIDLSTLSAWLTLRAVERETKRLEAIERNTQANRAPEAVTPDPLPQRSPAAPPMPRPAPPAAAAPQVSSAPAAPSDSAVPPLPPPVEVKPVPSPPARPQPPKTRPLVLTPQ